MPMNNKQPHIITISNSRAVQCSCGWRHRIQGQTRKERHENIWQVVREHERQIALPATGPWNGNSALSRGSLRCLLEAEIDRPGAGPGRSGA
jgi:hypothetical protein